MFKDTFYYIIEDNVTKDKKIEVSDAWLGDIGSSIISNGSPAKIVDYTWEFEKTKGDN